MNIDGVKGAVNSFLEAVCMTHNEKILQWSEETLSNAIGWASYVESINEKIDDLILMDQAIHECTKDRDLIYKPNPRTTKFGNNNESLSNLIIIPIYPCLAHQLLFRSIFTSPHLFANAEERDTSKTLFQLVLTSFMKVFGNKELASTLSQLVYVQEEKEAQVKSLQKLGKNLYTLLVYCFVFWLLML